MWQRLFALLMLILLAPREAFALNFNVRFCPEVDTDYEDTDAADGDFWDNDDNRPARGFFVRVIEDAHTGPPYAVVYEDYVSESGVTVGCTSTLVLSTAKDYDVTVISEAKLGTNYIYSVDDEVGQNRANTKVVNDYSPTTNEDVVGTPLDGATEPRWNHLAAAAYALFRQDAGLDGEDFYLATTLCGTSPTYPCAYEGIGIFLGDEKWKYLVGHEVGHTVSMKRDVGGAGCNQDCGAVEDGCHGDNSVTSGSGHGTLTKEYQSRAGCEGVADFYSSMVWNTRGASDNCEFTLWYRLDWDDDGALDTSDGDSYSCSGDPVVGGPVGPNDWLEDLVNADDDDVDMIQCMGTLINRSTPYDWNRYFWEMMTVELVPEADLWDIWDDANAYNWRPTDAGSNDYPIDRMSDAADMNSYTTEHGNQVGHGLDH